ncbi:IS3 family transposase [Streptomyces sp. NPDC094154]|uniref:IS3 family transposase n=1 Tax=Streptomyces sp. NPDC094154 TaxID=3366059 RepID=UPI0037FA26EA
MSPECRNPPSRTLARTAPSSAWTLHPWPRHPAEPAFGSQSHYLATARLKSARRLRNEQLIPLIEQVHAESGGTCGARWITHALKRKGIEVACCTVERLKHGGHGGRHLRSAAARDRARAGRAAFDGHEERTALGF